MTWKTSVGNRCLDGPEADLVRRTVDWMHDEIMAGSEFDLDPLPYAIPVFDQLSPVQKLAMLETVLRDLLTPTPTPPPLNAINEGAIAAIYAGMVRWTEIEIDMEDDPSSDPCEWRKKLLAVATAACDGEVELPEPSCRDIDEWEFVVDLLRNQVLWDDDYLGAELMLDAQPNDAHSARQMLGIDQDYFVAIPPDPKESEIPAIRKRLHALCRGT